MTNEEIVKRQLEAVRRGESGTIVTNEEIVKRQLEAVRRGENVSNKKEKLLMHMEQCND